MSWYCPAGEIPVRHTNADSGLGDWEPGLQMLDTWLGRLALPASAARRVLRVA